MVTEFNDLVGARAEDDVIAGEAVFLADGIAQGESGAVGVKVRVFETVANGLQGFGRSSEWIFVGGKFGDVVGIESVFLGDIGNRTSRLVRIEFGHVGVGEGVHVVSLCLRLS